MAADVVLEPDGSNPCCAKLMKKYLKLKNDKRMLIQGAKNLGVLGEKLSKENAQLKKALEEDQLHGKREREEKEKESCIRQNLEKEIKNLKAEISSYQNAKCLKSANEEKNQLLKKRIVECEEELHKFKDLLEKEKKRSDCEMQKCEMEKKKAAEASKLAKMEKSKAEEERKHAEFERNKAEEYRLCLEKVKSEATELRVKLNAENSKANDAMKRFEAEKHKIIIERKRVSSETAKAEEQKKLIEMERKKVIAETIRVDQLSVALEEEKKRGEELQKKIDVIVSTSKGMCDSCRRDKRDGVATAEITNTKLLREQLWFEKKEVKHAKRVAKLEKAEKRFIMRELHLLKHSFMQILSRFNILENYLSHSIEGTDAVMKIRKSPELRGIKLPDNRLGRERGYYNSKVDCGLTEACWESTFNTTKQKRECSGIPLARGSCTRPTSGIISELESPVGGSVRNKPQSSAVCSSTSFTDKRSMGSQEKDTIALAASPNLTKKLSTQRSAVAELPSSRVHKTSENEEIRVTSEDTNTKKREVENTSLVVSMHDGADSLKRRKVQDTTEPGMKVFTEYTQLHSYMGEKLSAFKDVPKIGGLVPTRSLGCGIYNNLESGIIRHTEALNGHENCKSSSNKISSKRQISSLEGLDYDKVKNNVPDKYISQNEINVCGSTELCHHLRGNVLNEHAPSVLNNEQTDLLCVEDMIRGNYLKLLDLDSDAEEERYRMAVEMPLSPTLPDIKYSGHQRCGEDDSHFMMVRDKSITFSSSDVMDMEVRASNTPKNLSTHENQSFLHLINEHGDQKILWDPQSSNLSSSVVSGQNSAHNCGDFSNSGLNSLATRTMETPLLLPDVELFGHHLCGEDYLLMTERDKSLPFSSFDVMDMEVRASDAHRNLSTHEDQFSLHSKDYCIIKTQGLQSSNISSSVVNRSSSLADLGLRENHIEVKGSTPAETFVFPSKIQLLSPEKGKPTNGGTAVLNVAEKKIFCAEVARQSSNNPLQETLKWTSLSTNYDTVDSSRCFADAENVITPALCVISSDFKDKDSILRMLSVMNNLSYSNFMACQIEHVVVQVHNTLATNEVLSPAENAGVLVSLLLYNITSRMSANSRCTTSGDYFQYAVSYAAEIRRVLSNAETRSLFDHICQLDVLASLIEGFLTVRKVLLISTDGRSGYIAKSSYASQLDKTSMLGCISAAKFDQFGAGCVILASVSAETDRMGYLLDASYKILRMATHSVSWNLLALHIFALVCGKEYFNFMEHSFFIIAVKSVVTYLERGNQRVSSTSSCLHPVCVMEPGFAPCKECPFGTGVICMEKLISLLLDVLECYINGVGDPNANYSVVFPVSMGPACTERQKESSDHSSRLDGLTEPSYASCCLFKFKKHAADLPDSFPESVFCSFPDIVSLVELVGCYMDWEWTCDKIMPCLSKTLEFCECEEFSAALFVLMGQLGRLGIGLGTHEQKGIAELRCTLSVLIESSIQRSRLPTQLAAIGALLKLLPLSFRDVVAQDELSSHAQVIKKWYSQLSSKNQYLSLTLFEQPCILENDITG